MWKTPNINLFHYVLCKSAPCVFFSFAVLSYFIGLDIILPSYLLRHSLFVNWNYLWWYKVFDWIRARSALVTTLIHDILLISALSTKNFNWLASIHPSICQINWKLNDISFSKFLNHVFNLYSKCFYFFFLFLLFPGPSDWRLWFRLLLNCKLWTYTAISAAVRTLTEFPLN